MCVLVSYNVFLNLHFRYTILKAIKMNIKTENIYICVY